MLGKLLKHDYRSMVFYFLLMYAVLIGIAVLARISIGLTGRIFLRLEMMCLQG